MILEQITREKLSHSHIVMPGDKIKLVITDGDKVRVVFSATVAEQRILSDAVMYDMKRGAGGRTGIGGFFLDKEE